MLPTQFGVSYPRRAAVALPFTRWELPGWGKIAQALGIVGIKYDSRWRNSPQRTIRGKTHGYLMDLSLRDFSERLTYFLGRYHELAILLLMDQCIRPGERIVDVGANIGMISLHAAKRVGPTGTVEAFEPNPVCADRIARAVDRNGIHQIRLHRMGLSDAPATLTLRVLQGHAGMGTLASVADETFGAVTSSYDVPVATADSVLGGQDRPVSFVKIDVEGFETRVLKGMQGVLSRWNPIVTTEVIPAWLERAGSSVAELTALMHSLGYRGYGVSTKRGLVRHRLHLAEPSPAHTDIVWIPATGPFASRLAA